jgi:hypothetical protein
LFTNGEQGWVYDPSNFATLFQDSTGTTPVTAVEQPVGLQLDLSQNLTLGPETIALEANRNFNGAGNWSFTTGVALGSGVVVCTSAPTNNAAYISNVNVGVTAGVLYQITFTITSYTSGGVRVNNGIVGGVVRNAVGTYSELLRPDATGTLYIQTQGASTTLSFTAVSIKQVLGNHRFQATSANRPVVSARVNLLTKTEEFDNAAWIKAAVTVTANATVAPDGTTTADLLVENTATTNHRVTQSAGNFVAQNLTASIRYKAGSGTRNLDFAIVGGGNFVSTVFSSSTGAVLANNDFEGVVFSGKQNTFSGPDAYGFYTATISVTLLSAQAVSIIYGLTNGTSNSYTGDGTSGIYVWGADLRSTNQGVGLLAYQRVNTSTDYTSTGFPIYIKANGSNQSMATNTISFTATNKITLWQGVRKLSDVTAIVVENSASGVGTAAGTFGIIPNAGYLLASQGTLLTTAQTSLLAAPITSVLAVSASISDPLLQARVNGSVNGSSTATQGTGNYGNYPAYFYARAGSGLFFSGNDYAAIVRGAASTTTQITDGENWVNSKTKAY